jgi:sortase A
MRHSRGKKILFQGKRGLLLILVSFLLFAAAGFLKGYQESQQENLSFDSAPEFIEKIEESDLPTQIIIPKVRINLPIFPGKVVGYKWEIANKGVSYLLGTGIPGRKGNTVIYGHNKKNQFGPIRWLKKDDEIKIINGKKEEFIYKVVETKTVYPNQVEVLAPTQDSTLTLYTCTGVLDRQRFILVARLQP